MPLIIEDGAGLPDSQSYATVAQLEEYAAARGITLTGDSEQLLLRAADYSETLSFAGMKKKRDQALQWPRMGVLLDGYYVSSSVIPSELVRAQIVTAVAIDDGRDPMAAIEPAVKEEQVDALRVVFQDGAASSSISVDISRAWGKLVSVGSNGLNQISVTRI